MNRFLQAAAILLGAFAGVCHLSAQTANIGRITLSGPNFGYQTVGVYNYTGPADGCEQLASQYNVCNGVSITSWHLTITFAANASGLAPSPLVFSSNGSSDAIGPTNASNDAYTGQAANPWTLSFNLQNAGCNPACDAQISSITFSGTIDTDSLSLYDSSAAGPYILDSLATQNFSVTWTIPATDYTAIPGSLFDATDILVTNQAPLLPQTITFNTLSDQTLGTPPPALSATVNSPLAVTFTSNSPSVCTVAGTAITLVSAGSCSITASQAGDSTYAAATPVTRMFNVAQASQTITFGPLSDQNPSATPPALSATASSGLTVAFASNSTSVCTVSDTTISLVTEGTCSITASQAGSTIYSAAPPVTQTFTVAKTSQTISFGPLSNVLLSAGTATVSATATSNLAVVFASNSPLVCTVSETTVNLVATGACSISASQPGDTTYAAAETATQTFNVQATQTITFGPISGIILTATPPALSATASSDLAVTFSSDSPSICTVSGTAVGLVAAGTCSITATQSGNNTYTAAPPFTQTFAVMLAPQTITFNTIAPPALGTSPALTATASSGLMVGFISNSQTICTVSETTVTLLTTGTCSITASQAGNGTYDAATAVTQTFTVTLKPQTITFGPINTILLTATPPPLSATASSALAVSFASTTQTICTVSFTTVTLVSAGTCSITASQAGDTTWAAATSVMQSFLITTLTPQTITFGPLSSVAFGTTPPTLSATAGSSLAVVFTSNSADVCTVSGPAVSLVSAGVCSITASQAGNGVYAAATPITQMFTVMQGANVITFNPAGSLTLGTTPPALSATASSGLTANFASTTQAVCTVSGTTLTLLTAGACTITASQAGNANYLAATPVTKSITINPASTGGGGGSGGGSGGGGGGGGGTSSLTVAPAAVSIDATAGGAAGTTQITLTYPTFTQGAPNFSTNFNTNQGQGWLGVSPASGAMTLDSTSGLQFIYTATLTISADPAKLTAGNNYTGTVNVNVSGGIVSVPVTVKVSSTPAKYTVLPQSLTFNYQLGAATTPPSQNISVFSAPLGAGYTVSATSAGGPGNWLSAQAGSATPVTPGAISATVNTSGFSQAGQFSGEVAINTGTSSIKVPVTLNIIAPQPPVLSVSPAQETFSIQQNGASTGGQVTVSNTGGGTLTFSASVASGGAWLSLNNSASASATPSAPASLGFTINPEGLKAGVYSGRITVSDTASSATAGVTVVLTVIGAKPQIQLSRSGVNLTGAAGASRSEDETVVVSNSGGGTLAWKASASTLSGGGWLRVSPAAGSLDASAAGSAVTISADPSKLKAGNYSGSINFTAQGAANSPQTVSVLLTVSASQPYPAVRVFTGGAVVVGRAGSTTPLQTSVPVFNLASKAITFSASTSASWLSVSPANGSLDPGLGSVTISTNLSGLSGLQVGNVTLGFDDGSGATIRVLVLALPGLGGLNRPGVSAQLARPMASVTACSGGKANFLIPVFEQPFSGSTVDVSSAADVKVQVIDDCGNAVTAAAGGSVQMTFSNGDPGINLVDTGAGVWEATWIPVNAASQVTLQVAASGNGLTSSANSNVATSETVTVAGAATGSAPQATGIANAASAGQATPSIVAPNSYIAIYGTNLAGNGDPNATAGQPLPTTLNGAQLTLGGLPLPLLYAASGQVNAVIPQGIAPNATYPLLVVNGTSQSVPVPLTVTELEPGTYTVSTTGSGSGIVADAATGHLITASNPAHEGQNLVIYMTGLGALLGANGESAPADGEIAPTATIFHTTSNIAVTIGGVSAPTVQFAGLTPTLTALYQVNVQMPSGVTPGSAVPVLVTATDPATGATAASNAVTIAVQ